MWIHPDPLRLELGDREMISLLANRDPSLSNDLDVNEIGIKHKLEQEIARFDKFMYGVLGVKKDAKLKSIDVDVKIYAKYILKEGTVIEKRELMGCLKGKFIMKDRALEIEK